MQTIRVGQPPRAELAECDTLRLGHVRPAVTGGWIPDVRVRRRDVEIAADQEGLLHIARLAEPPREPLVPRELRLIEGRVHHAPVRRIHAHHANAAAHGGHHPRLCHRLVIAGVGRLRRPQRLAEVRYHVIDARAAGDRDTVPAPLAMMRELIAAIAECGDRRVGVRELRLLHEEHVGLGPLEPPDDFVEPRAQRIDVPGRDAHRTLRIPGVPRDV